MHKLGQAEKPGDVSRLRSWRKLFGILLAAAWCTGGASIAVAADGAALFEAKCGACHSIGGGPRLGPDLKGIVAKRGKDGAILAIVDPAKAGLPPSMPNLGVSRPEAEAISAYIEGKETGAGKDAAAPSVQAAAPVAAAHPDDIQRGQDLFEGKLRFANGGPSCNACHHVTNDALLGGGVLASELTLVFSRMGKPGLDAMLANAPFPVMQVAYEGKTITPEEVRALSGFFQHVDKEHARQMPKSWGWRMFFGGAGGVVVLAGFFTLVGGRRKKRSVNQDIYDRQIKSE